MTYHRHSETCMIVVNLNKTHEEAERYCADVYSGGHLVYILDSETNNFTNTLLRENDFYHIGLSDSIQNGIYRWTNGQIANYTNFKAGRSLNAKHYYIIMHKNVWYESYDLPLKFICQTSAERKEFFFLNDTDFVNKTHETDVLTRITWKCGVHDEQNHNFQIFYQNVNETKLHLSHIFGKEQSHVTYAGCNSSGVYVCRITDSVNRTVATLAGTLKVRCRATYCNKEDANLNLHVQDHTGYTDENASQNTFKLKYNINFSYTEEVSNRGEIHFRLYNVTPSDYGGYYIHVRNDIFSKLYFKLAGPPQCPINLTSEELADGMIRLTWLPFSPTEETSGHTFDIFQADPTGDIKLATVSNQNEELTSYNVTGLTSNRNYSFYLHVKSDQFVTQCRHLVTWIAIKGAVRHPSGGLASKTNIVIYIISIVLVVVILVICVVITILVRKRNNHNKINNTFIDQKELQYFCGMETISSQQSSQSYTYNGNVAEASLCLTEVAENIYNNAKAQQGGNVLKPARQPDSSAELKEDISMATGDHQAGTLPFGKTLVTWGNEKEDANVYENTLDDTSKQVPVHKDNNKETAMHSNDDEIPNLELDKHKPKPDEDFRTVSAEGLIYISVEINRNGPQIVVEKPKVEDKLGKKKTKNKNQKEIVKEVKPSYEAVEYSSLDYLATSVAATEEGVRSLADTNE
uniref:C-type lectin domain-containing protein n=1 Tax=Biomphalaria glabrata TaxID=6526 RepID=A0A2C9LZL3_BIOGL